MLALQHSVTHITCSSRGLMRQFMHEEGLCIASGILTGVVSCAWSG